MGQTSQETVQVERMGYGPEAIAHLASGKVALVEGAAPGDVAAPILGVPKRP